MKCLIIIYTFNGSREQFDIESAHTVSSCCALFNTNAENKTKIYTDGGSHKLYAYVEKQHFFVHFPFNRRFQFNIRKFIFSSETILLFETTVVDFNWAFIDFIELWRLKFHCVFIVFSPLQWLYRTLSMEKCNLV